ncbi:PRKC apoptosis WT1 regulator protein [Oryzias melastigma]|uniref:PRKC apoptosis WT1 regulator protein n=1 Tax=Oryzias melastigma TaxID=30732 RepID=A0A834FLW3_ORYME|nr:PRKC apoptosis WT1 regulator protein [Oryzias melastigma]
MRTRLSCHGNGCNTCSSLQLSLDEFDDEDVGEKDRREEEELVQANTFQNEAMTSDPSFIAETPRSGTGRHKSSTGSEEEVDGNSRQVYGRHGREGGATGPGNLERRVHELEMELDFAFKENTKLLKVIEDKDDLIGKLKEEIDLLNRDLDDIEDENEQLKQENKTLLKVVGQLTRVPDARKRSSTAGTAGVRVPARVRTDGWNDTGLTHIYTFSQFPLHTFITAAHFLNQQPENNLCPAAHFSSLIISKLNDAAAP